MGPQNAVMGDDSFGTELPQTQLQEQDFDAEKRMVKFSKTKEFGVLKEHIENKIKFYQTYLPDGRALTEVSKEDRSEMWVAANIVIAEFRGILDSYDQAAETLKRG